MLEKNRTNPDPDFKITRVFNAPREMVFKAWTDPKYIVRWWGPGGFTSPSCTVDFRVGGKFLFCMRSPDGKDFWNTGVYREIISPEKIVSVMYFADQNGNIVQPSHYGMTGFPSEMVDVVTFEKAGAQTKLTIHRNHPVSVAKRFGEEDGWSQSLERFAKTLGEMG